jgi:5,10-methylenetetrahydromethanopterin reductase
MQISCSFTTSFDSPKHIALAERLGYARAWLYDTPHQAPDVWMILALAAERTERIGLGPGVLVPTLRHPMVNAAGAAALSALAPNRVAVAFGTGFSGVRALGGKPASWSYVRDYVRTFRGLVRGETTDWLGQPMRLNLPDADDKASRIDVPILLSAIGPKGLQVARDLADGLMTVNHDVRFAKDFQWAATALHGTILADGEDLGSPRVATAAGPGNALAYHLTYELGGDVTTLPGGKEWLDVVERVPPRERHLAVHDQHLIALNDADRAAWEAGSWAAIPTTTLTGSREEVAGRLAAMAAEGITEIIYQPCGDIESELEAFIEVARPMTSAPRPDHQEVP